MVAKEDSNESSLTLSKTGIYLSNNAFCLIYFYGITLTTIPFETLTLPDVKIPYALSMFETCFKKASSSGQLSSNIILS